MEQQYDKFKMGIKKSHFQVEYTFNAKITYILCTKISDKLSFILSLFSVIDLKSFTPNVYAIRVIIIIYTDN